MLFKNKYNKLRGFTLAELILAMAIVSILTAAMVPMLKHHKVRQKENFAPHGIIECYYVPDGDGWKLMQFIRDNDKYPKGEYIKNNGTSCEIPVPKANHYELHTIHAGKSGYGVTDSEINDIISSIYIRNSGTKKEYSIKADSDFAEKIKQAPECIVKFWKNTITCKLTARTFAGRGGESGFNNTEKNDYMLYPFTQEYASFYYGNGTVGNEVTINYPITPGSNIALGWPDISTESQPVLTITENGVQTTYLSINGTTATGGSNPGRFECNGKRASIPESNPFEISCNNSIILTTAYGSPTSRYGPNDPGLDSYGYNAELSADVINFTYPQVNLQYAYGSNGVNAEDSVRYFEKIRAEKLVLTPARTYKDKSKIELKRPDKNDPLFEIPYNEKEAAKKITPDKYKDIDPSHMPIPKDFNNDKVKPTGKTGAYNTFCQLENPSDKKGMCYDVVSNNETLSRETAPGLGGYGGYPLLRKFTLENTTAEGIGFNVTYETNGNPAQSLSNTPYIMESTKAEEKDCIPGTTYQQYTDKNHDFCKGSEGNPGAIILLW